MRRSSVFTGALLLLTGSWLICTRDARSQADSTAKQAEVAYAAVDFDRTRELATAALIRGGNSVRQTERLYFLLGIADAALGQNAEARNAFIALLAINPDLHLDRTLSPKLRAPYAEALGFWRSSSARLAATATPNRSGDELLVEISDPVDMVKLVAVQSRAAGDDFATNFHAAGGRRELSLPLGNRREFVISLLDEHKNAIFQLGSRVKPLRFLPKKDEVKPPPEIAHQQHGSTMTFVGGVLTTLGAVSVGSAIPFHLERNQKAKEWNSGACEAPSGLSRKEQCPAIDASREKAEQRAIVLYATGGALLAGGFITLLLAPNAQEGTSHALACEASFTSLLCTGHF